MTARQSRLGLLAITVSMLPHIALAQEAPETNVPASTGDEAPQATAPEQPHATSDQAGIAEIVVTAQRREESIQKVPISITALSSENLERLNIGSTEALQLATPGLQYTNSGGFPQPFIRGVGNDRSANSEASVATYVDGVYIAFSAGTTQDLYDVERVEVLRGPQGTLFGRNATGGAINIVTLKPSFEEGAKASVSYGTHDLKRGQFYLTGPISDTLAASLSFSARDQDSFHHNISPRKASNFREDESGTFGRAKLLWTPSSNFEAIASVDYADTFSFDSSAYRQIQPNATGFALGGITGDKPYDVAFGEQVQNKVEQWGATLNTRADLGGVNLVTISGYRLTDQYPQIELGGTDVTVLRADIHPTRSSQFSQEVQLQSGDNSPFDWILGAYYFHEDQSDDPYEATVRTLVAGTPTTVAHRLTYIKGITDSYSIFGQATVPITDQLKVTGGLRYTWEHREVPGFTVINLLTTPNTTTVGEGRDAQFNKLTYRAAIDYQVTDGALLYASYSRGFKAGIFNLSNTRDLGPVEPEQLDAYEVGGKFDLMGRTLRLNLSAFHYDFKNLQVTIVAIDQGGSTVLRNAAAARMNGGEAELTFQPTSQLQLTGSVSLLDAKYTDFPNFPVLVPSSDLGNVPQPTDLSGSRVMRSPTFTAMFGANYAIPLSNGAEIRLDSTFYHNSGYKFDPGGRGRQPSYDTVNGSITYTPPSGAWDLSIWGKNLTDERYYGVVQLNGNGTNVSYAPPITAGVTLSFRMGSMR